MVNDDNQKNFNVKEAAKKSFKSKKIKKKELKEKDMEKLGEKIKEIKEMSLENKQRVIKKVFLTLFTSAVVMLVFMFILMGYDNIPLQNYIVDLKVFSIVSIIITIIIFEYGYKRDSGSIALLGVESLIASFVILSLYYILQYEIFSYQYYLLTFTGIFVLYYIIKTIIIYGKEKYKYRNTVNDIKNIVKKEEI